MKRIKKIVIFLFLIVLFIPLTVHAEDTCADVMESVNVLESIEAELSKIDCDSASTDKITAQCNTLKVNKTRTLEKIFEYNDENICSSIDLSSIIEANSDNCTNSLGSNFKTMVDSIMNLFYVTAPFILIIFGSLDFFKIVVGNDPNEIKKHRSNFFKRLAAFLLLYLTPFIVKTLFSIVPYDTEGNSYICTAELSLTNKTTTPDVTGEYTGGNSTTSYNGNVNKKIAAAAKEVKTYVNKNRFVYGYTHLPGTKVASSSNTAKVICCASLVRASLSKAGVYDNNDTNEYACHVASVLVKKGWKVVSKKDLKAGDVLIFRCVNCSSANNVKIGGKTVKVGHVAIYAGKNSVYDTGSNNLIRNYIANPFWDNYGSDTKFYCGLRYVGN